MEKLTLVQIRAKFESTAHSFSYTVFLGGQITDKNLRSKFNAMNLLQNMQSILRLYSSSEKAFAAAHLQKNSKLYYYNRPKEINSNINMTVQLLPVMSLLRNFRGNEEHTGYG